MGLFMGTVRQLDFGDGDDGSEYEDVSQVRIMPLDSGYLLEADIGEEEIREAYMDRETLLIRLAELL